MVRQSGCTFTNISIDYLVKNGFNIFIEYNGEDFQWTAESEYLCLHASDPVRLLALYMIRDEWVAKKKMPNYHMKLTHGYE